LDAGHLERVMTWLLCDSTLRTIKILCGSVDLHVQPSFQRADSLPELYMLYSDSTSLTPQLI